MATIDENSRFFDKQLIADVTAKAITKAMRLREPVCVVWLDYGDERKLYAIRESYIDDAEFSQWNPHIVSIVNYDQSIE